MLVNLYPDGDIEEVAITDFGSCSPLLVTVKNRKDALNVTDFHSHATTAPFRAHELWDVPSEFVVTGKADAFSVGCCHYFNMVGKQPFDFNVGKIVLPKGWGTYFGDFAVECALGLTLRNPGERMGLGECKRAIERGGIDGVMRKLIEIEYGVELKRERGEYTFKKNKRGRGGGRLLGTLLTLRHFTKHRGGWGREVLRVKGGGIRGWKGRMNSEVFKVLPFRFLLMFLPQPRTQRRKTREGKLQHLYPLHRRFHRRLVGGRGLLKCSDPEGGVLTGGS